MARVVLVGYGQMLYSLIEGVLNSKNEILGVFRNDRIRYSSFELFFRDVFNPSKDYTIIKSHKLRDIKAQSVNSVEFIEEIKKLKPDLIIVGSWADYLNQKVSGLTIHFMNEKFDRGDIILQEAITIDENETGETLKDKTTALAKVMVGEFLDLYNKKQLQPIKQNEEFASYEAQLGEKEVIVDLSKPKVDVYRHLRALHPWACPYVKIARRYVKIPNYEFLEVNEKLKDKKPYEIIENNRKYFILKGYDFLIKVHK